MIKNITLSSLLMSGCISLAFSQTDTTPQYLHDVGFNTQFILDGIFESDATPFSVMYKKYRREGRATRYGLTASFSIDENAPSSSSYYTESSYGNFALTLGKEIQHDIGDSRWVWYFGGDLIPFYAFNNSDYYQNSEKYEEYAFESFGLRVRPFLGIRFDINERLYLSAEASAQLAYAHQKGLYQNTNQPAPFQDYERDNISFSLNPAAGIFFFYRF